MEGGWWSRGLEFESRPHIPFGSFFTFICCKNIVLLFEKTENRYKTGRGWPNKKIFLSYPFAFRNFVVRPDAGVRHFYFILNKGKSRYKTWNGQDKSHRHLSTCRLSTCHLIKQLQSSIREDSNKKKFFRFKTRPNLFPALKGKTIKQFL